MRLPKLCPDRTKADPCTGKQKPTISVIEMAALARNPTRLERYVSPSAAYDEARQREDGSFRSRGVTRRAAGAGRLQGGEQSNVGGLNLYAAFNNDPINNIDVLGMYAVRFNDPGFGLAGPIDLGIGFGVPDPDPEDDYRPGAPNPVRKLPDGTDDLTGPVAWPEEEPTRGTRDSRGGIPGVDPHEMHLSVGGFNDRLFGMNGDFSYDGPLSESLSLTQLESNDLIGSGYYLNTGILPEGVYGPQAPPRIIHRETGESAWLTDAIAASDQSEEQQAGIKDWLVAIAILVASQNSHYDPTVQDPHRVRHPRQDRIEKIDNNRVNAPRQKVTPSNPSPKPTPSPLRPITQPKIPWWQRIPFPFILVPETQLPWTDKDGDGIPDPPTV